MEAEKKVRKYKDPSIEYGPATVYNVNNFRLLNMILFPVKYDSAFYRNLFNGDRISRLGITHLSFLGITHLI